MWTIYKYEYHDTSDEVLPGGEIVEGQGARFSLSNRILEILIFLLQFSHPCIHMQLLIDSDCTGTCEVT